jgi:L-asparaginase
MHRSARCRSRRPRASRADVTLVSTALILSSAVVAAQEAPTDPARVAVFSGPTATIQNSEPLVTSNKARAKYGLSPGAEGFDALWPQRLAATVEVYIEAFSAHPLEADAAELYAPADGYLHAETGEFHAERQTSDDTPVYVATLTPDDGLYMLPYMARQADSGAWEGYCTRRGAPMAECRVPFYPDASRIFEEIDRFGIGYGGGNNQLAALADYDFYRPAPSGGYRNGLPEAERTDVGEGDIPPEIWGEDFFTYTPYSTRPGLSTLADATNMIQQTLAGGDYEGGIWLEGSPTVEESAYWFSLLVDTDKPLVGLGAQRTHNQVSQDGARNIIDGVGYVVSGIWQDEAGRDRVGGVMIQEEQIFSAREVQKGDDRPGGYLPTGGHGGVVGGTGPMKLIFVPTRLHTYRSEVNLTRLPAAVPGVEVQVDGAVTPVTVAVKDEAGLLDPQAMPQVNMIKHGRYDEGSLDEGMHPPIDILTTRAEDLVAFDLNGFVLEGIAPYGSGGEQIMKALEWASLRGMPVVRVGRGNHDGFTAVNPRDLFIEGENLTATKARVLLMASLLKLGTLPVPADPDNPTEDELDAIRTKVAAYQDIFLTH